MVRTLRRTAAIFVVAFLLAAPAVAGEKPPYHVLQMRPCGSYHPSPATPYAYGWFGADARTHAVRQTGYYGLHTQWSFR